MHTVKNMFYFASNKYLTRPIVTAMKSFIQFKSSDILTDKEVETYKKLFDAMDSNKDGSLSVDEIKKGLQDFVDYTASDEELKDTLETLDTNKNGSIEFSEFVNYMAFSKKLRTEKAIKIVFEMYDKNKDGFIDKEELRSALKTLGTKQVESDFENLLRLADKDNDGKISLKDFELLFDIKQMQHNVEVGD